MSETKRVSDLPDGYVVDLRHPRAEDIISRVGGKTWRFGEPVPDKEKVIPPPGKIVGMVTFKEQLFVATENGVYVKGEDEVFRPLQFSQEPLK